MRLTTPEKELLRGIEDLASSFRMDGEDSVRDALDPLRELMGTTNALYYTLHGTRKTSLVVDECEALGFDANTFARGIDAWIAEEGPNTPGFAEFPRAEERDRVLMTREVLDAIGWENPINYRPVFVDAGLSGQEQLRILICNGRRRVAWLGCYQPAFFSERQRRLMTLAAQAVRKWVLLRRRLREESLQRAALPVILDALVSPSYIVDDHGKVLQTNAAGRAVHDVSPVSLREELTATIRRQYATKWTAMALREYGNARRWLVTLRAVTDDRLEARARASALRSGLTTRQSAVLLHLIRGASNHQIAVDLGVTVRCVESHVATVFAKLDVHKRSEVVARILRVTS